MPRPTLLCCSPSPPAGRRSRSPRRWPRVCSSCPRSRPSRSPSPGFVNLRLTDDFWRAQIPVVLSAGSGYGAADLGGGRERQRRVLLGQSDRAAARRPRPRHRIRRRAREPARQARLAGDPRVLHQRRRRPDRPAGALGPPPLSGGARPRARGPARGLVPRRLPDPARPGDRRARRRALAQPPPRASGCRSSAGARSRRCWR